MNEHKNQKFKIIGDYLKENIKNIEQEESISINKDMINKMKLKLKNNKNKVMRSLNENKENENEKEMLLQIISSIVPIPKQRIVMEFIKISTFQTMIIFKHEIMHRL